MMLFVNYQIGSGVVLLGFVSAVHLILQQDLKQIDFEDIHRSCIVTDR